jgi:hypothetical protein
MLPQVLYHVPVSTAGRFIAERWWQRHNVIGGTTVGGIDVVGGITIVNAS